MTTHEGVDRFNRITATLFSELYEQFPDPVDITTEALGVMAVPEGAEADEVDRYQSSAAHVIAWLSAEGLLRYQKAAYGAFLSVVLTMKALTILGSMPEAIRAAPETLIDRLKKSLSKGASDAASDGIKNVLGSVFDLALRYGQAATGTATTAV